MSEAAAKSKTVLTAKRLESSAELKALVLNAVYESDGIAPLSGYQLLAARHRTTDVGIVVIDGDFNRDAFKLALDEIKAAGLKTSRMYAYGRTGSYWGQGISFRKFEDIGVDPDAFASSEKEFFSGYVMIDGTRTQLDFSAPPGASQQELDAAAFGALAMIAEVNYVRIG